MTWINGMARPAVALLVALLASALLAAAAFAHASLLGSKPRHGQTLERSPGRVVLTFDAGIEADFVQLMVEDAAGRRADRGEPFHPRGREELVAVRLRPGLEGTYVARYRVISEDGHPIGRRTTFRVKPAMPAGGRQPGDAGAMAAPEGGGPMTPSMEDAAGGHEELTGDVTEAAFAAARGAGYLAIALAIGGGVFIVVVWMPALAQHAGAGSGWPTASERFAGRLRRIVLGAVALGVVATGLAIVLEGATAAGVSFWAALDPDVLESVSDTRVVQAWGVRLAIWLLLGLLLAHALRPRRAPVLRRAALGAEGVALGPMPTRPHRLLLLATVMALALTAPMAGHSATHSPEGLLICVDAAHVLCMSVWLGGLAMLLVALAVSGRALRAHERTPLLAAVVGRFSCMATIVVALLAATGVTQAVAFVGSVGALFETAYGRLVLAKMATLLVLLALGAYNQRRSLPRLRRLAAGGEAQDRAAPILRRAVTAEVALLLAVLGVTSVLVATEPPVS